MQSITPWLAFLRQRSERQLLWPSSRVRPAQGMAVSLRCAILAPFLFSTLCLVSAPAPIAAADQIPLKHRHDPGKGPTGYDAYRHLDQLMQLRGGVESRQLSSTDPAQANGDFNHPLRQTSDGQFVIAEANGPGEIVSIWSTNFSNGNGGDVTNDGAITIELDGKTVLSAPYEEVVEGRLGAPWVWPFVGNHWDTSGGAQIKVPMPYQNSMRVIVQGNPDYFHVTYKQYRDATGVTTFDPSDPALDVVGILRSFGARDPKPAACCPTSDSAPINIAANSQAQLLQINDTGTVTELRIQLPQVQHAPFLIDDGRAYGSGGSSQFIVNLDPANTSVRLTRRYDPGIGHQVANVYVDGTLAGQWSGGASVPGGSWTDSSIVIPSGLTAGKSQITITNVFVSSDLDFNEFRYDVSCQVNGEWTRSDTVDLGPNHPGEELAHDYTIANPTWQGVRGFSYPVDSQTVANSLSVLSGARLQISFDGQTTVGAPLGEFFGSGLGKYDVRTLMFSIDNSAPDGWYTTWWPMPFAKNVTIQIVNGSSVAIQGGKIEVKHVSDRSIASRLAQNGDIGYFHGTYNRGRTTQGRDHVFLDTQGRGVFVGLTHTMRGEQGNQRGYLEGNERVYNDNELSPAWNGTGTEDFYESGWYFLGGTPYSMPLTGNPAYNTGTAGFANDTTGTYRLLPAESIAFSERLRFSIQHGPVDDVSADYSSVAFWYGQPTYQHHRTDSLDTTDPVSRAEHGYTASSDTASSLTSGFPGEFASIPVTLGLDSATNAISFRMAVDPSNSGVRLVRIGDHNTSYQTANVFVDGTSVGQWMEPWSNTYFRWIEDHFEIPVTLTRGKRSINIQLVPVAGQTGTSTWTAAHYEAVCEVPAFSDSAAPGAISHLAAAGNQFNSITLSWGIATDNVGVAGYNVYASKDPSVPVNSSTFAGLTPVPGFQHTGLGLKQTWYYRVQSVDGAGNLGPVSNVVSATTGNELKIEGESLLPPVSSTAPVVVQGNCCGVIWSGNAQLWFQAGKAGDTMTLAMNIPAAGTYDLSAVMTKAPDYGIVTLAVDGTQLGSPFDGYNASGVTVQSFDYGSVQLSQGMHQLQFTLTGKNAASKNYLVGIDYFLLTKTQ
jgi:hypothetical protein